MRPFLSLQRISRTLSGPRTDHPTSAVSTSCWPASTTTSHLLRTLRTAAVGVRSAVTNRSASEPADGATLMLETIAKCLPERGSHHEGKNDDRADGHHRFPGPCQVLRGRRVQVRPGDPDRHHQLRDHTDLTDVLPQLLRRPGFCHGSTIPPAGNRKPCPTAANPPVTAAPNTPPLPFRARRIVPCRARRTPAPTGNRRRFPR
jgi:hypothetical protein